MTQVIELAAMGALLAGALILLCLVFLACQSLSSTTRRRRAKVDLGPAQRWYWVGGLLIIPSVITGALAPGTPIAWVSAIAGVVGCVVEGLAFRAMMRRARQVASRRRGVLDTGARDRLEQNAES